MSLAGGAVSSASAVASAAVLSAAGTLSPHVAGAGAVIASSASALIDWPIVARVGQQRALTRPVGRVLSATVAIGLLGALVEQIWLGS